MPIQSFSANKMTALTKQRDELKATYDALLKKKIEDIWKGELNEFCNVWSEK